MLIKLKKERTHQEDRRLALWLATSAGLLNAIALGAFGFFPSHMTGNTSQFSSEVSSTDLNDIIFFATIILAFVTGAIVARIIVLWGIVHNVRLIFCQVLFIEGLLLAGVSLYEMFFHTFTTNREIIVFLCGLRLC
nr:YoaK family protein [Leclercia adecarboxylata]